jgi:hypothetical protein
MESCQFICDVPVWNLQGFYLLSLPSSDLHLLVRFETQAAPYTASEKLTLSVIMWNL